VAAKSWLVLGPGRTGSFTIVSSIYALYKNKVAIENQIGPGCPVRPIKPGNVIHTHNLDWLAEITEDTCVIISTRNPIESALSWCIRPKINRYHFFQNKKEDIFDIKFLKIEKFYLSPAVFLSIYNSVVVDFYLQLKMQDSYHLLDYNDWNKNPAQILRKLGYNIDVSMDYFPIKNPWSPSDWIENWEEISEICSTLPNNVNDLLG